MTGYVKKKRYVEQKQFYNIKAYSVREIKIGKAHCTIAESF